MPKPLKEEKDLMRLLGFKRLEDLERWLNQPPDPKVLARLGADEEEYEGEEESDLMT